MSQLHEGSPRSGEYLIKEAVKLIGPLLSHVEIPDKAPDKKPNDDWQMAQLNWDDDLALWYRAVHFAPGRTLRYRTEGHEWPGLLVWTKELSASKEIFTPKRVFYVPDELPTTPEAYLAQVTSDLWASVSALQMYEPMPEQALSIPVKVSQVTRQTFELGQLTVESAMDVLRILSPRN